LSLARSIIELHGGSVTVDGTPDGVPVVQCWLPLAIPGRRPRLSSKPALG
jgi:signal transduction histidine kinase